MSATTGSNGAWRAWLDDAAPKSQWQARLGEASRVIGKLAANPLAAAGLAIVAALALAALFALFWAFRKSWGRPFLFGEGLQLDDRDPFPALVLLPGPEALHVPAGLTAAPAHVT